jgi:hypothetical protein
MPITPASCSDLKVNAWKEKVRPKEDRCQQNSGRAATQLLRRMTVQRPPLSALQNVYRLSFNLGLKILPVFVEADLTECGEVMLDWWTTAGSYGVAVRLPVLHRLLAFRYTTQSLNS